MKIKAIIFFLISFCYQGFSDNGIKDYEYKNYFRTFENRKIILAHIKASKNDKNYAVQKGAIIGSTEDFPSVYSDKNDKQLKKIEELYYDEKFPEAEKLLKSLWEMERNNPIYLYFLGMTFSQYPDEDEGTIAVLEHLLNITEKDIANKDYLTLCVEDCDPKKPGIIMDLWFYEVYWKLGLCYFRTNKYEKSIFQLTRALYMMTTILADPDTNMYEFILSCLSKAYYFTGDKKTAQYYLGQVLKINPKNTDLIKIIK